ncbi:MAG: chemotaxis protein CheW, partial [Campylobacterota bacterium]|nr:chemotaxis protein CheW [Campylobacterota bacterium]
MQSYILFYAGTSKYALEIDRVERIMMVPKFDLATNKDKAVDGIFNYENSIIPILCFRIMISKNSYKKDLQDTFKELKKQHIEWLEALKDSLNKNVIFEKTTNPNACNLGKWLNSFNSYDGEVLKVLKELNTHHQELHKSAIKTCELKLTNIEKAKEFYEKNVLVIYEKTIHYLDLLINLLDNVANDSQKLLVLSCEEKKFALKVDKIDNIIHVDESMIKKQASVKRSGKYVDI